MINEDGDNVDVCTKHGDCAGLLKTCEFEKVSSDGITLPKHGMPVKDFVVSKTDVKDAKQRELDAKAVEWFNNQADLAEKDERISVLGIRVAALLTEADGNYDLAASQMEMNTQLEKDNRLLRDDLVALEESFDDLILKFDLERGRTQELESKNAELMTQFAALDADYDQLKVDDKANVDNLATIVSMYNELQNSATDVMGREMLYKIKIAKLKYKVLKAQIVIPNE